LYFESRHSRGFDVVAPGTIYHCLKLPGTNVIILDIFLAKNWFFTHYVHKRC
jgi:hypothetical protein